MQRKQKAIALICMFSMMAVGCGTGEGTVENSESEASVVEEMPMVATETVEAVTEAPMTVTELPETENPLIHFNSEVAEGGGQEVSGVSLDFANADNARITYTTNQNSVLYITSEEELSAYDVAALDAYDEAFFREKALVLVKETTSSGSAKVGMQSIVMDGSTISVTLSYETSKIGTADMATWLVWAEVDKGLEDYQWTVSNPALDSQSEKK